MEENTFRYRDLTIKIVPDEYPESPREWDNLGTIFVGKTNRYIESEGDIEAFEESKDDYIYLPLYLYVHSGMAIQTTPFSCPWDSGQIGYIAVSKDKIRKEYGKKLISLKLYNRVLECLRGEIRILNQFYQNDIYGFIIEDKQGNHIDSCCGFYGIDDCEKEARNIAEYHCKQFDSLANFNRINN